MIRARRKTRFQRTFVIRLRGDRQKLKGNAGWETLKDVKTDKDADQHRNPEQFSGDSFLDFGESTTSRMECLSSFPQIATVMRITSGSDEKQHDFKRVIRLVFRNASAGCGEKLHRPGSYEFAWIQLPRLLALGKGSLESSLPRQRFRIPLVRGRILRIQLNRRRTLSTFCKRCNRLYV